MPRSLVRLGLLALLGGMGLLAGCSSFAKLRLYPELKRANAEFDRDEYALAAAHFNSLVDRYPESPERARMRFRQGMALWKVHDYHDAEAVFQLYLELYPDGEDAGDARDYLQKIRVELSPANPARKDAIDQARSDLNQLQQLRLDHPNDPEVYYALANLYYEIGDYSEAARYYYQAQSIDAVYREKALIQERLVIGEDGQPHALTPGEVERLDREENPLVIYGTHTYRARAGDSVISGGQRYFNVSGYIRNQSSRWLRDVQIEVRFLNAVNSIQDVKTVRIGTMPPGAIRVFRAEATSFDNLYNIADFQAIPRVER